MREHELVDRAERRRECCRQRGRERSRDQRGESGGECGGKAAAPAQAAAAAKVRLQLQWYPQAQFAGYFAAKEQGYYQAENVDVTIVDGGGTIAPQTVGSVSTGPEFVIAWVPKVLQAREVAGAEQLVDIAQIFQRSGTLSVSWKASDITKPEDFKGKKVGVWDFGNEYEVTAGGQEGWASSRAPTTRRYIQDFNMSLLLSKQIDVSKAMIYNEYAQVLESLNPDTGELVKPTDLNVINWNDVGTAMLQDALFARASWLSQPGNEDIAVRFLRASFKGWIYCRVEPGRLHPVHGQRRLPAGRRAPALDDERDQSARLAVAERDRDHGSGPLEADRRHLARGRDHQGRAARGRLQNGPRHEGPRRHHRRHQGHRLQEGVRGGHARRLLIGVPRGQERAGPRGPALRLVRPAWAVAWRCKSSGGSGGANS